MINIDSKSHLKGESIYIDDIPELKGTVYGQVYSSPYAHAEIKSVDYSKALNLKGVLKILTYKDVPGENQIGAIIQDDPLFAENEVHYIGQPIALIIAETEKIARKARKFIKIVVNKLPIVTDPKESYNNKDFIIPPRTFKIGNTKSAEERCKHIYSGYVETGGQEHLYLETQGAYAVPKENGSITLYSSTQGPTIVQKITAKVLGISMNKIEVDVNRLGGGFGGKEDQATPYGAMASLGAFILKKPVKVVLHRHDDLTMTGKRHPYSAEFRIGLSDDLKIQFYEVDFIQNAGAAADLSPAIMERTLFHSTNCYNIPNTKITVYSCKTNLPPNTAFRGFGAPQGIFAIESALNEVSNNLKIPSYKIKEINLLKDNDVFSYGQKAKKTEALKTWKSAKSIFKFNKIESDIIKFNSKNELIKKGLSVIPLCFGISFTNTVMNHARALVHIYQDGSIGISTGAIEMGQGVNTKLKQVAAYVFSVSTDRIKIETTNTTRVANTSPTAASSGADLNGKAVEIACKELLKRLIKTSSEILNEDGSKISIYEECVFSNKRNTQIYWNELIEKAFLMRVKLSEKGHYSTPKIHFDKTKEKGHPFAYHVYGTGIITSKVDCLRGTYEIESVRIVHDFGKSINLLLDKGQIEGALIQGIGWVTMEEIAFDKRGVLLSNALSTYKVPDIYFTPKIMEIKALETEGSKNAILKSKAVGEPPFIYGIGAYFAIQNAIKSFNPNYKPDYIAPMTHEKVLMSLYQ